MLSGTALARVTTKRPSWNRPPPTHCARMNMKSPFRVRLWVLITALLLVAGGTIYGLLSAWHHVREIEAKLTSSQIARFQLASEARRELQSLNNSMLRYVLVRD